MPKPKKVIDPDSLEPVCPFTGNKLILVKHEATGMWRAEGPFYVTRMFNYKRELLHWLMHRNGVAPDFPGFPQITADEKTAPPLVDPVADQVEKIKLIQSAVDEYVNVNKKSLGLKA